MSGWRFRSLENLHSPPENAPPSQLALATSVMEFGRRESTSTASAWPSSAAMNGLENMRSIFAAFSARMRSRARANGCCKGSKFRCVGVGSPGRAGRWAEGACCRTDIFCESVGQVAKTSSAAELPPSGSSQSSVGQMARLVSLIYHAASPGPPLGSILACSDRFSSQQVSFTIVVIAQ
jgi:hypothetical protein